MLKTIVPGLFLMAVVLPGQEQRGRVAADFSGRLLLFETSAALAGETAAPPERVLESADGQVTVTAASELATTWARGVSAPRTDDHGGLRAYSFWEMQYTGGIGGGRTPRYTTGVVRHARGGWEVRRPGRVGLSRDGRWAVFAQPAQTLWLDLWTGTEYVVPGYVFNVDSVADDGSVVLCSRRKLILARPGQEMREFELDFDGGSAIIDRFGNYAMLYGGSALWRLDLSTGQMTLWVPSCNNCRLLDVDFKGSKLLYTEWMFLKLSYGPGTEIIQFNSLPEEAEGATLDGWGTRVFATMTDGIVQYDLDSGERILVMPSPTSLTRTPTALAPGMWVRLTGKGLSAATAELAGTQIEPLHRSMTTLDWVVPVEAPLGAVTLRVGQPLSVYEPATIALDVQLAAPVFIQSQEAGVTDASYPDWPVIRHASSGELVRSYDPARPGETITVLMTGLNGAAAAVEWYIVKLDTDDKFYPEIDSVEPHPNQPNWSIVRLRMPASLPDGYSALAANYLKMRSGALIFTSSQPAP